MKRYYTPEKYIQSQILNYLKIKGVYAWKNASGAAMYNSKDSRNRFVRFGKKGSADILGIHNGRLLAIEVKNEKGLLSVAQSDFLAEINVRGGIAFVAKSIEDVDKHLFNKYGNSKSQD